MDDEDNEPAQLYSYICELFAIAYLWFYVYGYDISSTPFNGDELRPSLMHLVLKSGEAQQAGQLQTPS